MRWSLGVALMLVVASGACDSGETRPPPAANPGATYLVRRGDVPFCDSGCGQERKPDGKLTKGMRFTLVSVKEGCWLVTLEDEVDTYIRPAGNLEAASGG